MTDTRKKLLSRSHSHHHHHHNSSNSHNDNTHNIKPNHEFSELITNIGGNVKSKVRLQQQMALEKITKEKEIQGNNMDWLKDTGSVLDKDDEVPFYGLKEKEYDDIKDTFITLSKEKHHLLFAEEKGYTYSTKSKSPIKLKPLRKLIGNENNNLDSYSLQSNFNDNDNESIISAGYPPNYDKSVSMYDENPEVILQAPPTKSKSLGSIGSLDRYSTYLNEVPEISSKVEDKYFGSKSKLHFYATYTELDRKKNIIHGGCSSLSSFIKEQDNSISQSVSTLLDDGVISAPPSSRNHPLPTDRSEFKQKSSVIDEESIIPEPIIIEKLPDEFLFDFYVVSCSHLMKADIGGTSDPVVKVYFNDVYVAETASIKNTLNPVWDEMEKFEIYIPFGMKVRDCKLDLEIFDLDKFEEPDFLGSVTFQGRELIKFIRSETGKNVKVRTSKLTNQRSFKIGISPKYPRSDLVILDHLRVASSSIQVQISSFNDQILNNEDDDSTIVTLTVEQNLGFENEIPESDESVGKDDSNSLQVPSLNLYDDMSDFNYRLVIDPQHDTEPKEVNDFIDDSFATFAPKSPRAQFLVGCLANNVPPTTVGLLRKRISNTINLAHMTLGDKLAILFAECIEGIPTVESLILSDNNLSHVSLTIILSKIQCLSELKILDISCNNLGPKAAALLQQYISSPGCPLKCLILKDISLDDAELARFVLAFKENSAIAEIDLSKNLLGRNENKYISSDFIGAGTSISELLTNSNMKLRRLNLEFNSLHSENSFTLCESVRVNTSLQYLNLSMNPIGRDGAISLAKALLITTTLEELVLSTCNIDCIGCFALVINSKECSTLKYLNLDSNLIGEEGGRAILHVTSRCYNRLHISCAMSDMNVPSPEDIIFKRKSIINSYSLDLSNVYERAIAFHILDLVACDPCLGFKDFIYKDTEGNGDELTLIKGSSTELMSDNNEISNLIELKKDLIKVRKVFRKVNHSGCLDQSMFIDFLTRLNINISKVDATFANFTIDANDNIKKIDENEAINFVVYLSNQALAVYENYKQETNTMGVRGPNKVFSRYTPPSEGTLLMTVTEEIVISRNYGMATINGIKSMTELALVSKNPLLTLLYVVDSNYFYFNEAKDLAGVLKKQSGDICLTLSYILPRMILSKDARRLVNFYIKDDKSKHATLQKLLGASYLIIIGIRDGYYSLELSKPLDRQAIELLFAHSKKENEKRKLMNKWDISQYMQWNGFRNVFLNGEQLIPHQSFLNLLPRSGKIEFDYIDVARPDTDLIPLNNNNMINLLLQSGVISSSQIEWARERLAWMASSSSEVFDETDLLQVNNVVKEKEIGVPIGSIIINLISCTNLENKDKGRNGMSDPFVIMSILDKSVESKHINNSLNPVFHDRFEIEWDGISQLVCNVWDEDFTKGNDPLGDLVIALASLDFDGDKKIRINKNLENAENGKIMMELEFKPKVDPIGTVIIHLISCSNLVGMDRDQEARGSGTSDPFVVMSLGLKRCESKHIFNCLDPTFNETFELEWDGNSPLYCQVWDDDLNNFDDPLGDMLVDLHSLKAKPTSTIHIKRKKLANIQNGTITMDISFKPLWKPIGKLSMKYISCNDLESRDGIYVVSDPYLVFKCGPNRIHTKVQMNTLNPVFDGIYDLEWDGKEPLFVEIWDSDNNGADDSLGEIKIDVHHYNFHHGKRVMRVLNRKLHKAGWGKITMDIVFYPSIASLNSNANRHELEYVEDSTRALSIRKNLEKLLETSEFQKRQEKWRVVEKKEQNLILTTTEATIDGDNNDDEYYSFTETAELPSLLNPDGLSSPALSKPGTPKQGSPETPNGGTNRMAMNEGSPGTPNASISRKTMNEGTPGTPSASRKTMNEGTPGGSQPSIQKAASIKEVEVTVEYNCSNTFLKLQSLLEPRLLLSRHIALLLEAFVVGQTARSNYGSYRVELTIYLLHCIADLHNFGLILHSLNPREHAQIIVRIGYLSFFNPLQPQGYYYLDHRQWDHRQMMKILLLINKLESDSSSFNNMIYKEITDDKSIHDAIPNNPNNDHDLAHPDIVPMAEQITHLTDLTPWHDEHSFPLNGTLSLNFLCSNACSELSEMYTKRFTLLPLLLVDHDEILRIFDTSLPIFCDFDDIDAYRQILSDEIKTRGPSMSRKHDIHDHSTSNYEHIPNSTEIENSSHDEVNRQDEVVAIIDANDEIPSDEPIENNNVNEEVHDDKISVHDDGIETEKNENDAFENEEVPLNEEKTEPTTNNKLEEIEAVEIAEDVSANIMEEKVHKYPRSSVDQLNTYLQMKTDLKWTFTFLDQDGDGILDEDEDDGFEL